MSSVDGYFIGYVRVHCFPGAELQSTFIYIAQLILSKSSDSPHLLFLNPYHGLFASLAPTHFIFASLWSLPFYPSNPLGRKSEEFTAPALPQCKAA